MAPKDIPFPTSHMPGQRPGEGNGRLVNAYCEIDGGTPTWRPVPGLSAFASTSQTAPRGMIEVSGLLYAAFEDTVVTVSPSALVAALTGTMGSAEPVTWARNNKAPTPDVLAVTNNNCFVVTSSAVTTFADADLPAPNSVAHLDGYFLWTIGDGRIFASDLNSTAVNALSFTTAQSNPDGLLRGTVHGSLFYAWGPASCETYQNVGASPFPLQRGEVIPVGLIGPWAIAGFETGWDKAQLFVASDGTVRQMDGYTPRVVSNKDVERAIASVSDKTALRASVYVVAGHPIWSLSSPSWTLEYNVATGFWHSRASRDMLRWRGSTSCRFNGAWVIGDTLSGNLLKVTESTYTEAGNAVSMVIESGPFKGFPERVAVASAYFDWTATADLLGSEDATNPKVAVQWSHDGGAAWSGQILERMLGQQGQFGRSIRVNRLGLSTHQGIRIRLTSSSPVYRTFRGGRVEAAARKPA